MSANSTNSETGHGLFSQWFVKVFYWIIYHIKRDKLYTLVHCKQVSSGINYDYGDKIGLIARIIFLISDLEFLPNYYLSPRKPSHTFS